MKRTVIIILLITSCALFDSCKMGRFVYYNFANITDHKIFPIRSVKAPETPFLFQETERPFIKDSITVVDKGMLKRLTFEEYLVENKTVAYLVIKNDSLVYEKYFNKYNEASIVNSFSMAKSVLSILVGIAIDEGKIKSIEEPVTNYLPEFEDEQFKNVTIEHLLNMTSGIAFNESYYNPFGDAATFYYGTNLRKALEHLQIETAPGTRFSYSSGDSQVLGMVLESALKDTSISTYLEDKLWQPLGMEYDATWSLDRKKNGVEKTFCCINARARDFAKIGRLYLTEPLWTSSP